MSQSTDQHECRCTNCGNGCSEKKAAAEAPPQPTGFFAARPWIWILVGYLAFVGVLSGMVVIAVKNTQPDVSATAHGH